MSETEKNADLWLIPIIAAVISSPFLFALFEYLKDKSLAKFQFKGYQAVFLDNGQVYFGNITAVTKNEIKLVDIYYLKVTNPNEDNKIIIDLSYSELVKLGSEIHGPMDQMAISRVHVLFIETLKDDSAVVKSIREQRKN